MRKLSTGHDSTLGKWHDLACVTLGPNSRPVEYLERQIAEHSKGRDAEVAGDESQFLLALILLEAIPRRPNGVQVNPLAVCPSCGSKCDGASSPVG